MLNLSHLPAKVVIECGCGREYAHGQSHCYCDYEYVIEGTIPTMRVLDSFRTPRMRSDA